MNLMLKKKTVFWITFSYLPLIAGIFLIAKICDTNHMCEIREDRFPGILIQVLVPFFFSMIFSLITYRMREQIFRRWLGFSIWATPLLALLTFLLLSNGGNGSGLKGVIGGGFDFMIALCLYIAYVIVSLYLIFSSSRMKR